MSQDNWRRVIDRIEMLRGVITQGKEVRMVNSPLAGKLVKKLTLRKRVDEKTFVASSSVEAGRRLIKALDGLQAVLMPVVAPVVPRMYQNV